MKSMGKVTAELLQQGRRESSEKHAVLLQDAESEASEMQRRARVMASKLETECHRMLHYEPRKPIGNLQMFGTSSPGRP